MIFLQLFYTFFLIGLFGFGGGYGMLSLIQNETVHVHGWLSTAEFTNIVAISQMTPGPVGINSATYCGYTAVNNAGYGMIISTLGSAVATFALVLPSFIMMIAPRCCRFAGCRHTDAHRQRELLFVGRESLAILHQRSPLRRYVCRYLLASHQSHPHDWLRRFCRSCTAILKHRR